MAEVIAIGSLLADMVVEVSEDFLADVCGKKGGMEYATLGMIDNWIERSDRLPKLSPGGSAANVVRGLAKFGHQCGFISKWGTDTTAEMLRADLKSGEVTLIGTPSAQPTGRVLALVTPDGQRTMRTFLGASTDWHPDELDGAFFHGCRLVHIEGYTLMHPGFTERAMVLAKQAGAQISFDLSSFEVTALHKAAIISLISQYVDVLFANTDEIYTLTGRTPQLGCCLLKDLCSTVVVTMGASGCWVGNQGGMLQCPAEPVSPLDTTGAGDLFTSGFLHGLLSSRSLPECAQIGAIAGKAVVQILGTTLSPDDWQAVKERVSKLRPLE